MKAPFYRVYIDNDSHKDLSESIESFIVEDCVEEDSLLRLTIKQEFAASLADDDDIIVGQIIAVQFGYIQGSTSELHRFRITDVMPKYRERVTLEVVCLDIGTEVKKSVSSKIWKNKTTYQIAKEIADSHGLELEGESTTKIWENIPQANKDDLSFLKYMAAREKDGNYIVYIRNKTLYFTTRNMSGDSISTFTYGNPEGRVTSFEPSIRESDQKPESVAAETTHIDPETGEITTVKADNMSEKPTGSTGTYDKEYNARSEFVGMKEVKKKVKKNYVETYDDVEEATGKMNNDKKTAILDTIEATLITEGEPLWLPDNVITVANVGKRFAGNWYTKKVRHTISGSGYVSVGELSRNGLGTGKTKTKDPNDSQGDDAEVKEAVKLPVFDANGIFTGYSSEDRNTKKPKQ